jgi:hypothetical protein
VIELKNNDDEIDSWKLYLFALKSAINRRKVSEKNGKILDFIGLEGQTIEEKSYSLVDKSEIEWNL